MTDAYCSPPPKLNWSQEKSIHSNTARHDFRLYLVETDRECEILYLYNLLMSSSHMPRYRYGHNSHEEN